LDISIPGESAASQSETLTASRSAAADLEGLVVQSSTAVTQAADDAGSLQQLEQLNSSSPGRSPHAPKPGWTVSGFSIRRYKTDYPSLK